MKLQQLILIAALPLLAGCDVEEVTSTTSSQTSITHKIGMYEDSIKLIESPEANSVSVCVYPQTDELLALGERINKRFDEAYMNGYNWDALLRFYVSKIDPNLMNEVETDPEAGMFAAYLSYKPENVDKMKHFASHVRTLLEDESALMAFIQDHRNEIEWD